MTWSDPEGAFEGWKECSRGRPCDYSGLSYDKLRGGGVQWPCTEEQPDGTERLYENLTFPTFAEVCEDYGHDVQTGATFSEAEFKALNSEGRAILKAAEPEEREEVIVDLSQTKLVDHSVMEKLHQMEKEFADRGKRLRVIASSKFATPIGAAGSSAQSAPGSRRTPQTVLLILSAWWQREAPGTSLRTQQ